jgi:hypothetical protein
MRGLFSLLSMKVLIKCFAKVIADACMLKTVKLRRNCSLTSSGAIVASAFIYGLFDGIDGFDLSVFTNLIVVFLTEKCASYVFFIYLCPELER